MVLDLEFLLLIMLGTISKSSPETSTGLEFLVVFPEDIAYYYPAVPHFMLFFTSLHNDTKVSITKEGNHERTWPMQSGGVEQYQIYSHMEIGKREISNKVIQISSNKQIAVEAFSTKQNQTQSALVLSTNQLGTIYTIPSFQCLIDDEFPLLLSDSLKSERSPFRAIVVNTGQQNKVILEGLGKSHTLNAHQTLQIYLNATDILVAVKAQHPVAVLVGHTCAPLQDCKCGMLYTALPPDTNQLQTFFIPPELTRTHDIQSTVLLSNNQSSTIQTYDPNSPVFKVTGNALFYHRNFLLPLIPESNFASCYAINGYPGIENFAVIVVHKDQINGVRLGNDNLKNPVWQPIRGTDNLSVKISLEQGKNILWHLSSKMGVYHMGGTNNPQFGKPAPKLSRFPDFRGCVVIPEVLEIGSVADGWRESVAHCRGKNLELVSFPNTKFKQHLHQKIAKVKDSGLERVWIGMRLSLSSSKWYWLNKKPLTEMDWIKGEPGLTNEHHCVAMNVEGGFGWFTEHCCMEMKPVCYRGPQLLPL